MGKKGEIKTRGGGNGVFSVRVISEEGEGRCVSFVKEKTETLDADRCLVAPTNLRQCLRHTEKSRPEWTSQSVRFGGACRVGVVLPIPPAHLVCRSPQSSPFRSVSFVSPSPLSLSLSPTHTHTYTHTHTHAHTLSLSLSLPLSLSSSL